MTLLQSLIECLGPSNVLTGADAQPYLTDWRQYSTGCAVAVVRPASTDEVAAVVKLCAKYRAPIVPQGGNTGQVAGATPDRSGTAVVVNMQRMNRIRDIDVDNETMTVEAGCILAAVQQAAREAGKLFPLSLGAEGSCFIGGNLATNAGGTQVLRYGNARELALGLEVVTAQGEVWHGLRGLRKDNTGYDLRDLFIGSEGTLGIITAATLKLFPLPQAQYTAFIALPNFESATLVLNRVKKAFGAALTGFEVMSEQCLSLVVKTFPEQRMPINCEQPAPEWFALLELSDSEGGEHRRDGFELVLSDAMEASEIIDAAVAASESQGADFWHLRESITLALASEGKCIKHDISLPTSRLADFVRDVDAMLLARFAGLRMMVFGHLGDGNLHYNMLAPATLSKAQFEQLEAQAQALVHDQVVARGGSISAEQGIGQRRVQDLCRYKDPVELALMARIKQALDPLGIMNPGKLLA